MADNKKKKTNNNSYAKNKNNAKKEKFSRGFMDLSGQDGFCRPKIEVGRWTLGMDLVRGNFAKLIGFNIFMLIFAAPIVALVILRLTALSQAIVSSPFAANVGLGFQPDPNLFALAEALEFAATWKYFLFLPLAIVWLGVGLSGGMFVTRNLAWGERVKIYKAFLVGVKRFAFKIVILSLFYGLILTGVVIAFSYTTYIGVLNGVAWYHIVAKVLLIIVGGYFSIWYFMAVAMGVSYGTGMGALLKNSLVVSTVLLPMNIFFAMLGAILFEMLLLGASFRLFALMFIIMFGMSFFMLVWTVYTQWLFDRFINPTIKEKYQPTEEEIEMKKIRDRVEREVERNDGFISVGQTVMSELGTIRPIAEGETEMVKFNGYFTRTDLDKAREAKAKMEAENEAPTPAAAVEEPKNNKKK